MRLKPFEEQSEQNEESTDFIREATQEALSTVGLAKGKTAKLELDEIRALFNKNGAGIEDVAVMTGSLIRASDKEETKLRAAELALKVQGVFKDIDEKQIPQITINIQGQGNQTLINFVCPQ